MKTNPAKNAKGSKLNAKMKHFSLQPLSFSLVILLASAFSLYPSALTNVLTGNVGDYSLNPQRRVAITITRLSPIPGVVGNTQIRNDSVGTISDANGNYAFTNLQWGYYSENIQGLSGTPFKFNVWSNTVGTIAIGSLLTNINTFPPNPATNYYTQAQVDATTANITAQSAQAINSLQSQLRQLPVVNVSSRGIANGLSIYTNNGAAFGPDTPGTHTCGLNEALASLPAATIQNAPFGGTIQMPGGGSIQMDSGTYLVDQTVAIPTNWPASYRFTGSGLLGTTILMGGNTATNVVHFEASQAVDTPINVLWDGVSVFCSTNLACTCMYSRNTSLTLRNSTMGCLMRIYTPIQPGQLKLLYSPNVLGLDLSASAGGHCYIDDNYFVNVASGVKITGDWCYLTGNHFECVSFWFANDGQDENFSNSRGTNSIESLGAAIILLPSANSHYEIFQNQFYGCNLAFATTLDKGILHSGFNNFEQTGTVWARATNIANGWVATERELISFDGLRVGGGPNAPQIAQSFIYSPTYLGDGSGLTNIVATVNPAQIKPIIQTNETIISRYIIVTNMAVSYQIDLQSMLNALPHATNRMYPGGGTIELGEGIFYTGGALYTNYSGVDTVIIKGKGIVQTCLVFTNNMGLTFQGRGNNVGLNLQGLLIASTVDSNYFLVRVQNNNRSTFSDVAFIPWNTVLTAPLGLELGSDGNQLSAGGLGGLWDDDGNGVGGDNFTVENCNFDSLALGLVISADHARINNNFFEGCNLGNSSSTWPLTSPFSLGGALILGSSPYDAPFLDVSGSGNHFFANNNVIVDLRTFSARHEIALHDSTFENSFGSLLERTNAEPELFLDGVLLAISPLYGIETNSQCQYVVGSQIFNPNFRMRVGNHSYGSNVFDIITASNYFGGGSGLTNLHFIKGISGAGFTAVPTPNADGSSNIAITVSAPAPTLAQIDAAKPGLVTNNFFRVTPLARPPDLVSGGGWVTTTMPGRNYIVSSCPASGSSSASWWLYPALLNGKSNVVSRFLLMTTNSGSQVTTIGACAADASPWVQSLAQTAANFTAGAGTNYTWVAATNTLSPSATNSLTVFLYHDGSSTGSALFLLYGEVCAQ